MTFSEAEMPSPAWRLKEIIDNLVVFQYATYRTNEELWIYHFSRGGYVAHLVGRHTRVATDRLPQERWAEIYQKAIAAQALLGRTPEIIEEIF